MKSLFVSLMCLSSVMAFSQLALTRLDGTPINDGDLYTFTTNTSPGCILDYKLFNTSTDTAIKMKCKVLSLTNTTGANIQLCSGGICVFNLTQGASYPNNGFVIDPGANGGNFDHFENLNAGNGTYPMDYVLKFYMVNANNAETGNTITITYRYNPNLGVGDFKTLENAGIRLQSNLVSDRLEIEALKSTQMEVYDMNGKRVLNSKLTVGQHSIEVSNLSAGVYMVNFVNEDGLRAGSKLVKK